VCRGGKAAYVQTDLGDDDLRGDAADPGDLIQPVDRRLNRGNHLVDLGLQLHDDRRQPRDERLAGAAQLGPLQGDRSGGGLDSQLHVAVAVPGASTLSTGIALAT
jgi:hypothetical protein